MTRTAPAEARFCQAFGFEYAVANAGTAVAPKVVVTGPLPDGLAVLILLQFVVTWLSVRSAAVRRLVRSAPTLLFYRGEFLPHALLDKRVTEDEVLQAVRASGRAVAEGVGVGRSGERGRRVVGQEPAGVGEVGVAAGLDGEQQRQVGPAPPAGGAGVIGGAAARAGDGHVWGYRGAASTRVPIRIWS